MISIYNNIPEISLSPRRIEIANRYNKIIQLGRQNPVWFIEEILGIKLLDYQKYVVMSSWDKSTVCWVFSRNAGKSFLGGTYITARSILFPNHATYIMSGNAKQSQDTFLKIENIAKGAVASLRTSNGALIINELDKPNGNMNGFIHDKESYKCTFYNHSFIQSLVGDAKSIVGKRSNLNVYDEAGKLSQEFFDLTEPFTTQNTSFVTGDSIDLDVLPMQIPTQCLYMSSAEDTASHLFERYKACARAMMLGRDDMFCADLSCEIPLHPTMGGKPYAPLLKQSQVDEAVASNEYKAMREYYNIFDTNGGTDCIVGWDVIRRNEMIYLPEFRWQEKPQNAVERQYGIFYDPALRNDGSAVLIVEFLKYEGLGWTARIVDLINLIETTPSGEKMIMKFEDQIKFIRQKMVDYCPNMNWEGLHLFVDPGAGGQGGAILDCLLEDFMDNQGNVRHGVVDLEDDHYKKLKQNGAIPPHAVPDILRAWSAIKYKTSMYDATANMLSSDMFKLPISLRSSNMFEMDGRIIPLNNQQLSFFVQCDLLKEEFMLMRKFKSDNGTYKYALKLDKQKTTHDDRPYVFAAACYYLELLRRQDSLNKCDTTSNMEALLSRIGSHG